MGTKAMMVGWLLVMTMGCAVAVTTGQADDAGREAEAAAVVVPTGDTDPDRGDGLHAACNPMPATYVETWTRTAGDCPETFEVEIVVGDDRQYHVPAECSGTAVQTSGCHWTSDYKCGPKGATHLVRGMSEWTYDGKMAVGSATMRDLFTGCTGSYALKITPR